MRNRRPIIAGIALAAALGLSACASDGGAAGPGSATGGRQAAQQLSADADLAAATAKLAEDTMRVEMDMAGAISMKGVANGKTGDAEIDMDMGASAQGLSMVMRKIGDDIYMKMGGELGAALGGSSDKEWMHIDAAKLQNGSLGISDEGDPAGTKALLEAATSVERVGEDGFKGTLDLTKSSRYAGNKDALGALGTKATAIPFTAKKDSEDRLVEVGIDLTALGAGSGMMIAKYSDFGAPVSVEAPPASQVQEMPSQYAKMFGN